MAHPLEVTDATFEDEVLNSDIPVLVDFWADWCAPCKMIAPIVNDISDEYEGRMKVAKVDVDAKPAGAAQVRRSRNSHPADLQGRQPRRPDRRRGPQGQAQGRRRRRPELTYTKNDGQGANSTPSCPHPHTSLKLAGADGLRWALRSSKSLVPVLPPGRWVRLPRAPATFLFLALSG